MTTYYIILFFIGFLKAVKDTAVSHYNISILPKCFNYNETWQWKYKNSDYKQGYKWYGLSRYIPCDGWHWADLLQIILICSIGLLGYKIKWYEIITGIATVLTTFTIFYDRLLLKNFWRNNGTSNN